MGGCRNRDQVLAWYRRGPAADVRATVTETVVGATTIMVGLSVSGRGEVGDDGPPGTRRQVLTVRDGLVADIRGFEDREAAETRMH